MGLSLDLVADLIESRAQLRVAFLPAFGAAVSFVRYTHDDLSLPAFTRRRRAVRLYRHASVTPPHHTIKLDFLYVTFILYALNIIRIKTLLLSSLLAPSGAGRETPQSWAFLLFGGALGISLTRFRPFALSYHPATPATPGCTWMHALL